VSLLAEGRWRSVGANAGVTRKARRRCLPTQSLKGEAACLLGSGQSSRLRATAYDWRLYGGNSILESLKFSPQIASHESG
jgi:hypothetical protein